MGLTPEDIEGRDFASTLRGYDRGEVRSYLARVAATVAGLEEECARLRDAVAEAAHGSTLVLAERGPGSQVDPTGTGARVAHLLEQARAQGEMIRQEAEELARVRVRAAMDQAEHRLNLLRTTEQASRARIEAAQQELADALRRLDGDPAPAFPPDEPERVVASAARVALGDPALAPSPAAVGLEPVALPAAAVPAITAPIPPPPPPPTSPAPALVAVDPAPPAVAPASPGAPIAGVSPGPARTRPRRVAPAGGDDALASLVRQAMQRAVESARPGRGA